MRSSQIERKIAFVTSTADPHLTWDDRMAAESLREAGMDVVPAIWDDSAVKWTSFNAVVVRSPWDYHHHPERFIAWMTMLEQQHVQVWNPAGILRWNMNKRYLRDLERKGIAIPRTLFIKAGEQFQVEGARSLLGTDEVVLKPVVSASAHNTWRCSLGNFSDDDRRKLNDLVATSGMMIQEFMPEIATEGELSLIFFGNRFSHAVRKYPGKGDFRVQEEHGGSYLEASPPDNLIRHAHDVLESVESELLYARVDGVVRSGDLVLMELELLEPSLYFDADPAAAPRFSARIAELMTKG